MPDLQSPSGWGLGQQHAQAVANLVEGLYGTTIPRAISDAEVLAPSYDTLHPNRTGQLFVSSRGALLRSNATPTVLGTMLLPADGRTPASICFFGDSTTQYAASAFGNQLGTVVQNFTAGFVALWVDDATPSGVGSLVYNATTKTLTWAPFGSAAGAPVDASVTGFLTVPGPSAGQALYLVWFGAGRAYTSGTSTITVQVDGFQLWSYSSRSHVVPAFSALQWRYKLAALPAGCPPGMDGIYGLGGATITDLIAAYQQWKTMQADIAVIQVGTNEFTGSMTADQYFAYFKQLCSYLFIAGTLKVVWCTILPRNTDTATQQRRKARAAGLIAQYAAESQGRVTVFDASSIVTDPTTGQWRAGFTTDGIHYSASGGMAVGFALADYLATLNAASVLLPASYQDTYDATENVLGNLATGGTQLMVGTGGTLGTGASGQVATGWTVNRNSGAAITATCSKVARTDTVPGAWQQIVLAGAVANEVVRMQSSAAITAGLTVGAKYTFEVELQVVSSTSLNLMQAQLNVSGVNARDPELWQGQGTEANLDSSTPRTLWLRMAPGWALSAGATNIYITLLFGTSSGGSATIRVGRVRLARVA